MKTNILIMASIFCCLAFSCNSSKKEKPEVKIMEQTKPMADPVKHGEHLVNSIGCSDCHTPKIFTEHGMELDTTRLLSGHPAGDALPSYDPETSKSYVLFSGDFTAAVGPWGTSFAANLTPDPSGIGSWTEDEFLTAIRKGLYKGLNGSRPLLPPMPWPAYRNLSDQDLKAIFAYLKSIKPVNNVVPSPIPPKG